MVQNFENTAGKGVGQRPTSFLASQLFSALCLSWFSFAHESLVSASGSETRHGQSGSGLSYPEVSGI